MALKDIYKKASLVMKPAAMKAGKVYSQQPHSGAGDFSFSRDSEATVINEYGLIEALSSSVPRLSYDLIYGKVSDCPHLLLEPQRTNSLAYSEDFTNAFYSKQGGSSVTPNTTTAPNGTLTADTLSGATGTNVSGDVLRVNVSSINVESTLSIYCKSLGSDNLTIYIRNGSNGSVTSESISLSNEWQRIDLTSNPATGQVFFGNTNGDVAIWGAQIEEGSYLTSYIPTEASSVTRLVDQCEITSGLEDVIGQTEGTVFLDFEYLYETTTDSSTDASRDIFTLGTASDISEGISIDNYRSQFRVFVQGSGMTTQSIGNNSTGASQPNTRYKLAIKYKTGDCKAYLNGSLLGSSTGTVSFAADLNGIFFSYNNSSRILKNQKKVYSLSLFKEALSDSELQTLTTL